MRINFEEIFSNLPTPTQQRFNKYSLTSQASTAFDFDEQIKVKQLKQLSTDRKRQSNHGPNLRKKNPYETKRVLQTYQDRDHPQYFWYNEFKLDEEPQQQYSLAVQQTKLRPKQLSAKQTVEMVTRLSKQHHCTKKSCLKTCSYEAQRRLKNQMLPLHSPLPEHKRTLTQIVEYETKNPSELHERLYNERKARQFRNNQLKKQYQITYQQKNNKYSYQNKTYTKNYIPFYKRLDKQIIKRKNKKQIFKNHVFQDGKILSFKPDVSISMKTLEFYKDRNFMRPRKQKYQIKGYGEMKELEKASWSVGSSIEKVMNRSVEIVRSKEEKMINKITNLFEHQGYFKANVKAIEEMDEIEFSTFWPLISQIETTERIKISDFEARLRQYYNKLPKYEQQNLRTQNLLKDKKIRQLKKEATEEKSRQKFQLKEKQKLKVSVRQKDPTQRYQKMSKNKSDYLNKIKNYV